MSSPRGLSRQGRWRLVVERELEVDAPQVVVADARAAMAPVAARFWGDPTAQLRVVGVTGTNGKTTTAFLVREILEGAGISCGLLGTVKQVVGGVEEEVERTTPEAIDLQATFRRMLDGGDRACAMEVSSHAMALHRADAIHFEVALFTNLTQDHLDFHADMEDYFGAKRKLFEAGPGTAIVNVDDPYGRRLAEEFDCITFSAEGARGRLLGPRRQLRRERRRVRGDRGVGSMGLKRPIEENRPVGGEVAVRTGMPGHFNVANALGAFAVAVAMGVEADVAAAGLARAGRVPGRFEPIDEGQGFAVLVDYAHTPDSLENVLRAARRLHRGAADRRLRRRRRPRSRQAAEDGAGRGGARRSRGGHLRQPALRGPGGDRRRSRRPGRARPRSWRSRSTAAPRSRWRWGGRRRATPS